LQRGTASDEIVATRSGNALRQILAIILVLRNAVFEEILAIAQGGPRYATWVAAWYSYLALMIGVMAVVYMRVVYRRVMLEAARIDGCTRFGAFVSIVLPLATPALATCGVIMFIISWHELLIPLILNARPDYMTLLVVIASLVGDVYVFFNLMMAICLLALAPTVILVALLQKYIVEGLAAGAVKG
jgi:ABC-type glycerol-3-phosphate transport system permease component